MTIAELEHLFPSKQELGAETCLTNEDLQDVASLWRDLPGRGGGT